LDSLDGEIGKVKEFYFDDTYWAIRYLVADSGNWFSGRQVLISRVHVWTVAILAHRMDRPELANSSVAFAN